MGNIITITTDFGLKDAYTGVMKGVIFSINPSANIVDITHEVSPQNILEGAIILSNAYQYFPKGTIHMGIIDPDVGGKRKPILIETERYLFVGPDNGIFSFALEREKIVQTLHLNREKYFLKNISNTFHGRDVFAPVAAHLSLGVKPNSFGKSLDERLCTIKMPKPIKKKDSIAGAVIYIDSFGNLITNIKAKDIASLKKNAKLQIIMSKVLINGISKTYADGRNGRPVAIIGSSNHLEIACYAGSASEILQIKQGERVDVRIIIRR